MASTSTHLPLVSIPDAIKVRADYHAKVLTVIKHLEEFLHIDEAGNSKLLDETRLKPETTEFVLNLVECIAAKVHDKQQMTLDIMNDVFSLSVDEQIQIQKDIEYIIKSGLVKRVGILKKLAYSAFKLFKIVFLP